MYLSFFFGLNASLSNGYVFFLLFLSFMAKKATYIYCLCVGVLAYSVFYFYFIMFFLVIESIVTCYALDQ